jgi:hypothetical protein
MIVEPKHKPDQDDCDRKKRERMHQEEALDEALKNTFPASDPVSVEQPLHGPITRKLKKSTIQQWGLCL